MLGHSSFDAGGETYSVCYTARARYLFEELAGYPLQQMRSFSGVVSDVEVARFVCAGLEGYRRREKDRKAPWTVDEVLDDVLGDLTADQRTEILRVCLEALSAAFRRAGEPEDAKGDPGKVPTTV